jgi:hypothetical protein
MSMSKTFTYGTLKTMLEQLGFQEAVLPSSHSIFSYPGEKDLLLVYRAYQPDEVLDWTDMAKTRRFLDAWGLVDEKAFEQALQDTAA